MILDKKPLRESSKMTIGGENLGPNQNQLMEKKIL